MLSSRSRTEIGYIVSIEPKASTETTLDRELLIYSFFSPTLETRFLIGLPTLMRFSMMPATSLLTFGPPKAPGPLWSRGGGEGVDRRIGAGEEALLTGAEKLPPPPLRLTDPKESGTGACSGKESRLVVTDGA